MRVKATVPEKKVTSLIWKQAQAVDFRGGTIMKSKEITQKKLNISVLYQKHFNV